MRNSSKKPTNQYRHGETVTNQTYSTNPEIPKKKKKKKKNQSSIN